MLLIEAGKGAERGFTGFPKLIGVGNQYHILFIPVWLARQLDRFAGSGDVSLQARKGRLRECASINLLNQIGDRIHRELGATAGVVFMTGVFLA